MSHISALMSIRNTLLRLISAGKNGKNVFISAKSSVVSKRASESHKHAYDEPQKRASEAYKHQEKREERVHKRQKQCCFQARL